LTSFFWELLTDWSMSVDTSSSLDSFVQGEIKHYVLCDVQHLM